MELQQLALSLVKLNFICKSTQVDCEPFVLCMEFTAFCDMCELVSWLWICLATLHKSICKFWGQFNKEIQVYFTSRTLVFTNSHQFESTKSLYKFPLEASNLYLQWYSIGFNQLQVKNLHTHSAVVRNYTCSFFIELAPGFANLYWLVFICESVWLGL